MAESTRQDTRNVARSVLYGFSTWAFPLLLSFAVTPIIIGSLGNADYGIYVLVLGFIGYSFNLNFVRAITKELAASKAKSDMKRIGDVISASVLLNVPMGLIGVAVLWLIAEWLVADVLLIPTADRAKTVTALYIASGILFLTMLNQFVNATLQGMHRFDLFSKLFNANTGLLLIGNAVLAYLGYGLNHLLMWNLGVLAVMVTVGLYTCLRVLPGLRLNLSLKNPALKSIISFSAGIVGYQVLSNGLLLFERGWIMRKLGPEDVTFYVVPLTLAIYIHGFIASLMLVVFPLSSELAENKERLSRLYLKATKTAVFLVFFISASVFIQGYEFLAVWLGVPFAKASWLLLSIHAATFSIVAIQIISWQMMEGLGRTAYNFWVFSVCLVASVSLMLILTADYGGTGVAIARLVGFAAIFASVFAVEKLVFGAVKAGFWLRTGASFGFAGLVAGALEYGILSVLPPGWIPLAVSTFAGFAAYFGVAILTGGIGKEEKLFVKGLLAR